MSWCHIFDEHWCSTQTTWGNRALEFLPLSSSYTELFRKWTHLFIRPLCPSGGFSQQWLSQSEAAALWKWWSFITCDTVTRCNQLMSPNKSDKSPFASWLSRFCGWRRLLWGHNAAPFWTGQSRCIVGSSSCSLILSLNEKTWISRLPPPFYLPSLQKKKKKSIELMTFIAPVCRQHSEILSVYGEQLVPMWASDELCRDVLVEVICLLWGSREDVEKSAPSQLLQGVLQCRGLTEKVEGKRQLVCSLSASVYHRASLPLPTTAFVFY